VTRTEQALGRLLAGCCDSRPLAICSLNVAPLTPDKSDYRTTELKDDLPSQPQESTSPDTLAVWDCCTFPLAGPET